MEVLMNYSWHGNIRELENAIERACVTSQNGSILPQFFPHELVHNEAPKPSHAIDLNQPLPELLRQLQADVEQEYIRQPLDHGRGNVSHCAKMGVICWLRLSGKLLPYPTNKRYSTQPP